MLISSLHLSIRTYHLGKFFFDDMPIHGLSAPVDEDRHKHKQKAVRIDVLDFIASSPKEISMDEAGEISQVSSELLVG